MRGLVAEFGIGTGANSKRAFHGHRRSSGFWSVALICTPYSHAPAPIGKTEPADQPLANPITTQTQSLDSEI